MPRLQGVGMRVTMVTETYFPQVNGVSRALSHLVESLATSDDKVQLLTPRYPGTEDIDEQHACTIRSYRSLPVPFYPEVRMPIVAPGTVRRDIRAFGPDIIHVATEGWLGRCGMAAARRLRTPVVLSYHTNFPAYASSYHMGFLSGLVWRYLRRFHNRGFLTLCPSRSTRDILEDQGFERVRVWSRGVDQQLFDPAKRDRGRLLDEFGITPETLVLLYVGRVAEEKNLGLLADAFAALESDSPVCLLIIGDGPAAERLRSSCPTSVIFGGYRRGEQLARMYASADLFVFPSVTETFGNVVLEAMASGLPVIAFDAPGPRDIIQQGHTGWLTAEVHAPALTETVSKAIQQPDVFRRMGRAARRYAEKQTWSAVNQVVRRAYLEALAQGASAP